MADLAIDVNSILLDSIAKTSQSSKILKSYLPMEDINYEMILDAIRETYWWDFDSVIQLSEDEAITLYDELHELNFKILFKPTLGLVSTGLKSSVGAYAEIYKHVLLYVYFGISNKDIEDCLHKRIFEMTSYEFDDFSSIYDVSGPTIKKVLRPILAVNKMRLFS